jgi:hypothetical protein
MAGITYMAWSIVTSRDLFGYPITAITAIDHMDTMADEVIVLLDINIK